MQVKYHHGRDLEYTALWQKGNIIGVAVDLDGMSMSVFVDGEPGNPETNGIVFNGEELKDMQKGVFPAVSFCGKMHISCSVALRTRTVPFLHISAIPLSGLY